MPSQEFATQGLLWLVAAIVAASIGARLSRSGQIRLFSGRFDLFVTAMTVAIPLAAFALVQLRAPASPEALRAYLGTAPVMDTQLLGIAFGLAAATVAAMSALRTNGLLRGLLAICVKFIAAPLYLLALPVFLLGGIIKNGPLVNVADTLRDTLIPNSAH